MENSECKLTAECKYGAESPFGLLSKKRLIPCMIGEGLKFESEANC